MPDELLTVQEVADRLRLNQQTIRNMIDRGELAAVRVGSRRVRIRQSDLDDFLGTRTAPQKPPQQDLGDGDRAAWASFEAALVEGSVAVNEQEHTRLVQALERLSKAAAELVDALRIHQS